MFLRTGTATHINRFCQRRHEHDHGSGCVPVLPSARHGHAWRGPPDLRFVSEEYDEHFCGRCHQPKSTHQPDVFECSTASRLVLWAELGHGVSQDIIVYCTNLVPEERHYAVLGANCLNRFLDINERPYDTGMKPRRPTLAILYPLTRNG